MVNASKEKQIVKAGVGYTIGNYLLKGLSFFSIPIFSRLMSTADYGLFNTFCAYESIIFVMIGLALHSSFKNAKYKYGEDFNKYVSTCVAAGLLNFFCWLIVANVFYFLYGEFIGFSQEIVNLLLVCSMGSALIQYYNVISSIDYRYDRFIKISGFNAIASIIISVMLMMTIYKNQSYVGRIIGISIPIVVISVYIIIYFAKQARLKLNKQYLRFAVKFSLPVIPHGLSQVVLSQFDRIMINSLVGASEAGLYSFSYNIYVIIQVTTNSLDNVWSTWFFESANKEKYYEIKKASSEYIIGMLMFSSIILLASPELIKILSPKSYWGSIPVVVPVVIGGFFSFLYTLPVQVEYYYEKTKYIAIGTMSAALINIILNAYFIPLYGYIAAAYTTLATYFFYFLFHYMMAKKIAKRNFFDGRSMLFSSLSITVAGGVCLFLLDAMVIRMLIVLCMCIGAFFYAQKKFNIIEKIKHALHII